MEFKGTQGKWEINPRASRNVRCSKGTVANCSSGQSGDNQEEEEANAKLIASAPEMFEMLNYILDEELFFNDGKPSIRTREITELLIKITE